ncbi:hypothetical protein C8R47DRAFT_1198463 [Mycena vitilis]|nr:hypothetical protein C8R47DRAFT_1198463 [Mycena vitilis]
MSHLSARAAHIRHAAHANRAGGFGGFDPFSIFFPTDTDTETVKATKTKTKTEATVTPVLSPSVPVVVPTTTSSTPVVVVTPSSSSVVSSPPVLPSTSSTPTTSSTITTPTTHSSVAPTTTHSATALHDNLTKIVSHIVSVTASTPSASSSSTAVASTSNALVAPVLGGVAGGIIGLAGLIFLLTFCLRRRRNNEDAVNFDPGAFRRSAVMLDDPPTHTDTVTRGYNPPPMMEQRRQMTYPGPEHYDVNVNDSHSPTSGSQLVFQAPFSPIAGGPASPVSAYDHTGHSWGTPAPVLTRNISGSSAHEQQQQQQPQYAQYPGAPVLTRNISGSSAHEQQPQYAQYSGASAQYPSLPAGRTSNGNLAPAPQYVDMERTSVTPFQAEQYVEISKALNTEVPKGLDTPAVDEFVAEKMAKADLPPLPVREADPFASQEDNEEEEGSMEGEEVTLPMVQEMSFPAPPSPVHTSASRYRVDSTPPMLPEIFLPRGSVSLSDAGSSSGTPTTPSFPGGQTLFMKAPGQDSPVGGRFPVSPSPLASSFTVATPPAASAEKSFLPQEPPAAQPRPDAKKRQSVYTVYDPEDAYGGI